MLANCQCKEPVMCFMPATFKYVNTLISDMNCLLSHNVPPRPRAAAVNKALTAS